MVLDHVTCTFSHWKRKKTLMNMQRSSWLMVGLMALVLALSSGCGSPRSEERAPESSVAEKQTEGAASPAPTTPPASTPDPALPGQAISTSTGLIYQDVVIGKGPTPLLGQRMRILYTGRLKENGPPFDQGTFDYDPIKDKTIRGWLIGIAGSKEVPPMRVGGTRKLTIPPHLGYGGREMPNIPPNSTLLFEVQLARIL